MSIPTSTILHRHFKLETDPIKALLLKTDSSYEKSLLTLKGVEFNFLPTTPVSSLSGLDFDVIISQGKREQYQNLLQIAYTLHCPLISLETNLPGSPEDVHAGLSQSANATVFSNYTSMGAWQHQSAKVIYEPLDAIPVTDTDKVYSTVAVDIDNQTLQLAQQLGQMFPIAQIPQDNNQEKGFAECGIFVNLASPNPEVMNRLKMAVRAGCIILTWGHPLFQELVVDGHNGFIFSDPNQLAEKLKLLRSKGLEELKKMGQASQSMLKTKFGRSSFEKEWLRILRNASNTLFTGV